MSEVFRALVERNGVREEAEVIREQNGFDGMTGQPVYTYRIANGFDGMTGEPLFADVEQFEFDPMTGQPVYRTKAESVFAKEPLQKVKNSISAPNWNKLIPILCAAGGAVLILVILLICFLKGAFLSNRNKVALATYRTIQDSTVGEMLLNAGELLTSNELTTQISAEGSAYGYGGNIDATLAQNRKKGQLYMNANVDVSSMFSQEVNFLFDDSSIQFSLPDISDDLFYYNYAKPNEGAFADIVEQYTDCSIEDVNTVLECLNNMYRTSDAFRKKARSNLTKAYKDVEVIRIDSDEFEVDGKERKCKGYEMHLTEGNVADFVVAVSDAASDTSYTNDAEELIHALASLSGDDDIIEAYDRVEDADDLFTGDDEIDIEFYLYGGKLAAIRFGVESEKITVEFRGGDTRCSNVEVIVRNKDSGKKTSVGLESERKGNKEKGQLYFDNVSVASYTYDLKKGSYNAEIAGEYETDGVLLIKKNSLKFQSDVSGDVYAKLKVNMQNDARIPDLKGDMVDIGRIDEDELERTATRFVRQLMNTSGALDYLF